MMFTGNPPVGGDDGVASWWQSCTSSWGCHRRTPWSSAQKGDLSRDVNQTAMKTAKKIREARGGILVDEAYQLTQALQRGQSDFSGEAIDEMMKVMNDSGRKAVTFVFAGYRRWASSSQYNAEWESRIKQVPPADSHAARVSHDHPYAEPRERVHPPTRKSAIAGHHRKGTSRTPC